MQQVNRVIDGIIWNGYDEAMQFRLIANAQDGCVRLLARPNLESIRTPVRFASIEYRAMPFPWANSRWVRFLRWLSKRVKLPEPFLALVTEKRWEPYSKISALPADIIESVLIQMAELARRGMEPVAICCGPRGIEKLSRETKAWAQFPLVQADVMCPILFGLPVRFIPWMEPDAVMVV